MSSGYHKRLPLGLQPTKTEYLNSHNKYVQGNLDYSQDDSINNNSNFQDRVNKPSVARVKDGQFILSIEHQKYLKLKYGKYYMKRLKIDTYGDIFHPTPIAQPLYSKDHLVIIIHGKEIVLSKAESYTLLHKWNEKKLLSMVS